MAVEAGKPSPVTGFAVTVPGFLDVVWNETEVLRWVKEANARLQEYERRNRESQERGKDDE